MTSSPRERGATDDSTGRDLWQNRPVETSWPEGSSSLQCSRTAAKCLSLPAGSPVNRVQSAQYGLLRPQPTAHRKDRNSGAKAPAERSGAERGLAPRPRSRSARPRPAGGGHRVAVRGGLRSSLDDGKNNSRAPETRRFGVSVRSPSCDAVRWRPSRLEARAAAPGGAPSHPADDGRRRWSR